MEIGTLVFFMLLGFSIWFAESTRIGKRLFNRAFMFIDGLFETLVGYFSEI